MKLTLQKMMIDNFKGIKHLELVFDEKLTSIRGRNGIGKTSIADAYIWCLFGISSNGESAKTTNDKFRIKPLDADNKEIHNLETSVELECLLDGEVFTVRHSLIENWGREKGATEPTYKGDTNSYSINGATLKESEFAARISKLCDRDTFEMISILNSFNGDKNKEKRRSQLLAMADGESESLLFQKPEYDILLQKMKPEMTVGEFKKYLEDQNKTLNKQIAGLPARIDEVKRTLPDITEQQIADAEYNVVDIQKDIDNINLQIAQLKAEEQNTPEARISALQAELIRAKGDVEKQFKAALNELQRDVETKRELTILAKTAMDNAASMANDIGRRIEEQIALRDQLRTAYKNKFSESIPDVNKTCPTCGRELPEEKVTEAIEKLKAEKTDCLTQITQKGQMISAEIKRLSDEKIEYEAKFNEATAKWDARNKDYEKAVEALDSHLKAPDYSINPRISEIESKISELQKASARTPEQRLQGYEERKQELSHRLASAQSVLYQRDALRSGEARIDELKAQLKSLGGDLAENEQLVILCEKFVTESCKEMEVEINSKFETVQWKLFDVLKNGNIKDVCTCLIPCDGALVPYDCANTASQINANIEIISALSKHYDVQVPLFIDNAERVLNLAHSDTQVITLSVSNDDELKVA